MIRAELIRPPQAVIHTPHDEFERQQWHDSKAFDEWKSETARWHAINAMCWICWALDWGTGELANAMQDIQRGQHEANEAERWAANQHLIAWC